MEMQQGGWLSAIEQSALGVFARESVWLYPTANVLHILALTVFAASIAMLDLRLLGAFRETTPGLFVRRIRLFAAGALLIMLLTGGILFAAEAPHVWANPVFRIKLALIGTALVNALIFELAMGRVVDRLPPGFATPVPARISAAISLALWFGVAAAGRLIAYF
jgi:hypothetical protein